uniref:Uncharacterized protein n=1 Tax=Coccolithus braarudii TaxID=221442 RepID=A0A7S0L9W4_9EUKA|mmetsp:Transcript_2857/g.5959  ORF Transcript_2857/g.5959 Transcript_2857/m.5959 type:complete len:242 (+) Transcript_2857:143-868(+)
MMVVAAAALALQLRHSHPYHRFPHRLQCRLPRRLLRRRLLLRLHRLPHHRRLPYQVLPTPTRSRIELLEAELREANIARGQLEVALAIVAEAVEATRARVEEVLPMELDEVAPMATEATEDSATFDSVDESTVDSDDDSVSEGETEPDLTAAQQWSLVWGAAKARAEAKAKATKAAAKAAGKTVEPAKDWDIETFRRIETATQKPRTVPVAANAPTGKAFDRGCKGPIKHARQGFAGAVQF